MLPSLNVVMGTYLEFIYYKKNLQLLVTVLLFDYHFFRLANKSYLPAELKNIW